MLVGRLTEKLNKHRQRLLVIHEVRLAKKERLFPYQHQLMDALKKVQAVTCVLVSPPGVKNHLGLFKKVVAAKV
jgi:hypothetical protein